MNAEIVAQPDAAVNLVRYETARRALKEASQFDEVKTIRDKTQALALYAKQARDTEMARWVSEIKIRAERKCGEMLKLAAESKGRATQGRQNKGNTMLPLIKPNLSELGIEKMQSTRTGLAPGCIWRCPYVKTVVARCVGWLYNRPWRSTIFSIFAGAAAIIQKICNSFMPIATRRGERTGYDLPR